MQKFKWFYEFTQNNLIECDWNVFENSCIAIFIDNAAICMQITYDLHRNPHWKNLFYLRMILRIVQNMNKFTLNLTVYTIIVLWKMYTKIQI